MSVARGTAVLCVVQARTGSTRLPGKVLRELGDVSMLEFLLRRLEHFGPAESVPTWSSLGVVVATTDRSADDPIVEVAERCGVGVVRGDEFDVLGRFARVVNDCDADHVVRLTADCPLTDPLIVEAVVTKHLERGAHYTTNVLPRTFPKGLDVEVIDCGALLEASRLARDPVEREHVTPYLYRRPERYVLANLRSGRARSATSAGPSTPLMISKPCVRSCGNLPRTVLPGARRRGSTCSAWWERPRRNPLPVRSHCARPLSATPDVSCRGATTPTPCGGARAGQASILWSTSAGSPQCSTTPVTG